MDQMHWSQGAFRYRLQAALAPVGVFLEGSVELSVSKQKETAVGRHRHVGAQCGCARVFYLRVFFFFCNLVSCFAKSTVYPSVQYRLWEGKGWKGWGRVGWSNWGFGRREGNGGGGGHHTRCCVPFLCMLVLPLGPRPREPPVHVCVLLFFVAAALSSSPLRGQRALRPRWP
jgi:hypothetical protein